MPATQITPQFTPCLKTSAVKPSRTFIQEATDRYVDSLKYYKKGQIPAPVKLSERELNRLLWNY